MTVGGSGGGSAAVMSPQLLGILCVIAAVTTFSTQDMVIKWLSGDYPLHQIVFIRGVVAIVITLAIFVPLEGSYRNIVSKRLPLHLLRGLSLVIGNMAFFAGIAALPLAEGVAIFFMAPLIITVLSVPFLGERVGLQRWLAVLIGFCGVMIMVQPGSAAFQAASLLPLVAAFAYASLQIMTRKIGLKDKASTMAFYIQLMFILASSVMWLVAGDGRYAGSDHPSLEFLLRAWIWPPATDFAIIVGLGCLNAIGGYLISQGYRVAEAGLVAPFEYVAIPLSIFWSVLIWKDWPDALSWLGIFLICGGGLYVIYRETLRGRQVAADRPMPRQQ